MSQNSFQRQEVGIMSLWRSQEAEKEKKQNGQSPTDLKIMAQFLHIYSDQVQSLAKLPIINERAQAGCPVPTCTADQHCPG